MSCRRSRHAARSRQGGAALVVALLVFAISAALIVGMTSQFNRLYQRAGNIFLADQAQAYLRGAEGLAVLALQADYDADGKRRRDDLLEMWAQQAPPYALDEGGWLRGSLEDLQGRFNLNALAEPAPEGGEAPRFTAAQAQFIRLLQALGEPELGRQQAIEITQAVADWLDSDQRPRNWGAEDDYYFGQTPAYRAANRPMASSSELLAVSGVSPELYRALAPWVTVWPRQPALLNIHTAPATVLRSIAGDRDLDPLTQADVDSLVEQREETGFADLEDFLSHPVFAGRLEEMVETRKLLGEYSNWFLLSALVDVAGRNQRLYSVLQRRERTVEAQVRAGGSL